MSDEFNLDKDRSVRALKALILWIDGFGYREIGKILMDVETQTRPVTRARAQQMVDLGERLMFTTFRSPEKASAMADHWNRSRGKRMSDRRRTSYSLGLNSPA